MNSNKALALMLAISVAGIIGCSKPAPQDDSLPQPGASASAGTAATTPGKASIGDGSTDLADFTVDPGQVFNCEGRDRATSNVKWSVKDPAVATVKILVSEKGSTETKTFAAGGNMGEAMTGNWVSAGVTFSLVDGKDEKVLASYEVPMLACS